MGSAREKLNQAFVSGSVLLAGAAGLLAQSWPVFWLALAALLASSFYFGEIRLRKRPRR
jgi:hypothetical protein